MCKKRPLLKFWIVFGCFILGCVSLITRQKGEDTIGLWLNIAWVGSSLLSLVWFFIRVTTPVENKQITIVLKVRWIMLGAIAIGAATALFVHWYSR